MRVPLIALIVIVGCTAVGGAAQKSPADNPPLKLKVEKAPIEAMRPSVPLEQLVDETPDGAQIIMLYQAARTVVDIEAANANVKAQVAKVQTIATDIARLHTAAAKACEDSETTQIDAIALKAKAFSATVVRVENELTKSLATMRQKQEAERPASIRAKEDVNRFSLATHELVRLRVQVQEIAKTIDSFGVSLRKLAASCTPMQVLPLFAERVVPSNVPVPARRPPTTRPAIKPPTNLAPRFAW
jgi:response regulator RpfG family c-di-GMP phosphodiesterase